jgi:hypothetical protein
MASLAAGIQLPDSRNKFLEPGVLAQVKTRPPTAALHVSRPVPVSRMMVTVLPLPCLSPGTKAGMLTCEDAFLIPHSEIKATSAEQFSQPTGRYVAGEDAAR